MTEQAVQAARARHRRVRAQQQRKIAQVERHRARYRARQQQRAASPTGGRPVGLPELLHLVAEQVKVLVIRRMVVEALSLLVSVIERWLVKAPVKTQGKAMLAELSGPEGKELLHEVVKQFV